MSCCGSQRAALRRDGPGGGQPGVQHWNSGPIEFEFSGGGQLVVTGPLTGSIYQFASGVPLTVHASDAPSLAGVPGLRPVR